MGSFPASDSSDASWATESDAKDAASDAAEASTAGVAATECGEGCDRRFSFFFFLLFFEFNTFVVTTGKIPEQETNIVVNAVIVDL